MWPNVRAALITLVLFFCVAEALPLPTLKKRHMNRAVAKDEADRWVGILAGFGVEFDRQSLVDEVLRVSRKTGKIRHQITKPWRKFERPFGISQRWALFTFTDPYPGRLVIESKRAGGTWEELYRAPQDDGSALARLIHYRKVRGLWDDSGDRPHPGKLFERWVTWLGRRIFQMYPEVEVIRLRFDQVHVQPPSVKRRKTKEKTSYEAERYREDYR